MRRVAPMALGLAGILFLLPAANAGTVTGDTADATARNVDASSAGLRYHSNSGAQATLGQFLRENYQAGGYLFIGAHGDVANPPDASRYLIYAALRYARRDALPVAAGREDGWTTYFTLRAVTAREAAWQNPDFPGKCSCGTTFFTTALGIPVGRMMRLSRPVRCF